MKFATAKKTPQRVTSDGQEYALEIGVWTEIPDELAEEIAPHRNIEVSDNPKAAPEVSDEPETQTSRSRKSKGGDGRS